MILFPDMIPKEQLVGEYPYCPDTRYPNSTTILVPGNPRRARMIRREINVPYPLLSRREKVNEKKSIGTTTINVFYTYPPLGDPQVPDSSDKFFHIVVEMKPTRSIPDSPILSEYMNKYPSLTCILAKKALVLVSGITPLYTMKPKEQILFDKRYGVPDMRIKTWQGEGAHRLRVDYDPQNKRNCIELQVGKSIFFGVDFASYSLEAIYNNMCAEVRSVLTPDSREPNRDPSDSLREVLNCYVR